MYLATFNMHPKQCKISFHVLNAGLEYLTSVEWDPSFSVEQRNALKSVVDRCLELLAAPSAAAAQTPSGNTKSGETESSESQQQNRVELSTSVQRD